MTKIIHLNQSRPFDEARYNKHLEKEKSLYKQQNCKHKNSEIDSEIDEVICLDCLRKFNSFEYLTFIAENETGMNIRSYDLSNKIYFLEQKAQEIEEKIISLKKEKRLIERQK